jgi:hypothetical protein
MGQKDLSGEDISALFDRIRELEAALEPFAARGRAGEAGELEAAFRRAAELLPAPAPVGSQADEYFVEEGRQQDA